MVRNSAALVIMTSILQGRQHGPRGGLLESQELDQERP
jgi:hypothetical protein